MRKSRILFFADRLLDLTLTECYNGGGWITSFLALTPRLDAEVGMAGFFPVEGVERHPVDKATMYKMPIQHESAWAKVKKYYLNQQTDTRQMEASVREVLSDFKPDLIYLFGLDYLSSEVVLNLAEVPVLVHLQGVLGPIVDAYFPPGISKKARDTGNDETLCGPPEGERP